MKTTCTAANLWQSQHIVFSVCGSTYAAVTANTSVLFAVEKHDKATANTTVNTASIANRAFIVFTQYSKAMDPIGRSEATIVVIIPVTCNSLLSSMVIWAFSRSSWYLWLKIRRYSHGRNCSIIAVEKGSLSGRGRKTKRSDGWFCSSGPLGSQTALSSPMRLISRLPILLFRKQPCRYSRSALFGSGRAAMANCCNAASSGGLNHRQRGLRSWGRAFRGRTIFLQALTDTKYCLPLSVTRIIVIVA